MEYTCVFSVKRDFTGSALCWDALAKRCWRAGLTGAMVIGLWSYTCIGDDSLHL